MRALSLLLLLLPALALSAPAPTRSPAPIHTPRGKRFFLSNLHVAHYTPEKPAPKTLFGELNPFLSPVELPAYTHPRIVTTPASFAALVSRHAASEFAPGSWSSALLELTRSLGPTSTLITKLSTFDTSAFTAAPLSSLTESQLSSYRDTLRPLASFVSQGVESSSHALFLCAFWARVSDERGALNGTEGFLGKNITRTCTVAATTWAKALLAHRIVYCPRKGLCSYPENDDAKGFIWDFSRKWEVNHDWHTSGLSLALAYDVLYKDLTTSEQDLVRSALALLVMRRWTWGTSENSTKSSPNAEVHPHRIYGNWAMYHSNLYLANLAIEGESGFVPYADAILRENNSNGFNQVLHQRFTAMMESFMVHTINPDGSTFEDGYTYHIGFREGSLGLISAHLRGSNVLNTDRFRNTIHNAAQMWEPWRCAPLVGHSSGGGLDYNAYVGLFRYAYPNGPLPQMMWKQRFGEVFDNRRCRIFWTQTMTQLTFFGDEHASPDVAISQSTFEEETNEKLPLAYVSTRRGLIISRGSLSERSSYMHLDARPDSFFLGHDNADRGVITFSALGKRWFDDLLWISNVESRRHSLMHVDGLAQAEKAPSVTILKAYDGKHAFTASADLTYAYNVQWAKAWQGPSSGRSSITEYNEDGSSQTAEYFFTEPEENSPWDLGWPMEDDASEIGFNRSMTLNGYPNLAFAGMFQWKRNYRKNALSHMVRSTVMVRPPGNDVGFGILIDCAGSESEKHVFESYLILSKDVHVAESESRCNRNTCLIVIQSSTDERLDVHVRTIGTNVSFRTESFDDNKRLIVKSQGLEKEEFWMAFLPQEDPENPVALDMIHISGGKMKFKYQGYEAFFSIDEDFAVNEVDSQGNRKISPASPTNPKGPEGTNDSNEVENANNTKPMEPDSLSFLEWKKVEFSMLNADKKKFYQETETDWQYVLRFTSVEGGGRLDRLSTCRGYTTADTEISVYDCGQGNDFQRNYNDRNCVLVGRSDKKSTCSGPQGQRKADFVVPLKHGDDYIAVVSVSRNQVEQPNLMVAHKLLFRQ